MQAFNDLRQAARDRRDKLIAKARQEYEDILAKLAVVERDLLGRDPGSLRSKQASVERVIPADRPFTGADILLALEATDPRRPWRRGSVLRSCADHAGLLPIIRERLYLRYVPTTFGIVLD
jgi:hypothetical protein